MPLQSPRDKLVQILNCCKIINDFLTSWRAGAGERSEAGDRDSDGCGDCGDLLMVLHLASSFGNDSSLVPADILPGRTPSYPKPSGLIGVWRFRTAPLVWHCTISSLTILCCGDTTTCEAYFDVLLPV